MRYVVGVNWLFVDDGAPGRPPSLLPALRPLLQAPSYPAPTSAYQRLPEPTGAYRRLPEPTGAYRSLPAPTGAYRRLPFRRFHPPQTTETTETTEPTETTETTKSR